MPFNINSFMQRGPKYGGARPSKFDIQVTVPPSLAGIDPSFPDKLNMTCKAASLPGYRIGVVEIPYFGRKIKSAGDRTWDDWRISVILDEDFTTRAAFEAWSNAINRLESNVMQASFDGEGYKTIWNVLQYSKDGVSPIRAYDIIGGWPSFVGPVTLDWEGVNRLSEFEVTVPFDNMTPSDGGENPWAFSTSTTFLGQVDSVG